MGQTQRPLSNIINSTPRIALIGYGYWGTRILPYLDERFDVKYVFGRSLVPEGRFINNLSTIWDDKDVEAVVVATPIDAHYNVVLDALHAGKHVLCEKPLALVPSEAERLRDIAVQNELQLVVDFTYTFSPGLQKAATLYKRNKIGTLNYIEMSLMRRVTPSRRIGFSVNQLLSSKFAHLVSVLNMFVDIKAIDFQPVFSPVSTDTNSISDTGIIRFRSLLSSGVIGQLCASIEYPAKYMGVKIFGTAGNMEYCMEKDESLNVTRFVRQIRNNNDPLLVKEKETFYYNEADNLVNTVNYFRGIVTNAKLGFSTCCTSNLATAVEVTKIIADTCNLNEVKSKTDHG